MRFCGLAWLDAMTGVCHALDVGCRKALGEFDSQLAGLRDTCMRESMLGWAATRCRRAHAMQSQPQSADSHHPRKQTMESCKLVQNEVKQFAANCHQGLFNNIEYHHIHMLPSMLRVTRAAQF